MKQFDFHIKDTAWIHCKDKVERKRYLFSFCVLIRQTTFFFWYYSFRSCTISHRKTNTNGNFTFFFTFQLNFLISFSFIAVLSFRFCWNYVYVVSGSFCSSSSPRWWSLIPLYPHVVNISAIMSTLFPLNSHLFLFSTGLRRNNWFDIISYCIICCLSWAAERKWENIEAFLLLFRMSYAIVDIDVVSDTSARSIKDRFAASSIS